MAFLDFDALECPDVLTENGDIVDGRHEGLVTPAIFVVDVLADDLPVVRVELVFANDIVGIGETVEDESAWVESAMRHPAPIAQSPSRCCNIKYTQVFRA